MTGGKVTWTLQVKRMEEVAGAGDSKELWKSVENQGEEVASDEWRGRTEEKRLAATTKCPPLAEYESKTQECRV